MFRRVKQTYNSWIPPKNVQKLSVHKQELPSKFPSFKFPLGGCAVPGGRCNTGPTLRGEKQASTNQADSKNRLISMVSIETVPEIKPIRTDTTH